MTDAVVALSTCETWEDARRVARHLVESHLAACVNLVPQVESIYYWQEKLVTGQEILLVIKTRRECLKQLAEALNQIHPYEIPELIVLPIEGGLEGYLHWIESQTQIAAPGDAPNDGPDKTPQDVEE